MAMDPVRLRVATEQSLSGGSAVVVAPAPESTSLCALKNAGIRVRAGLFDAGGRSPDALAGGAFPALAPFVAVMGLMIGRVSGVDEVVTRGRYTEPTGRGSAMASRDLRDVLSWIASWRSLGFSESTPPEQLACALYASRVIKTQSSKDVALDPSVPIGPAVPPLDPAESPDGLALSTRRHDESVARCFNALVQKGDAIVVWGARAAHERHGILSPGGKAILLPFSRGDARKLAAELAATLLDESALLAIGEDEVRAWARTPGKNRRDLVFALVDAGIAWNAVQDHLRLPADSVRAWKKRYERGAPIPARGRPSRVDPAELRTFLETRLAADGKLTATALSEMVVREFGVSYHPDHISRILRQTRRVSRHR